jgi:hypothetical protein
MSAYAGYGWIVGIQHGGPHEKPMIRIATDPLLCIDTVFDLHDILGHIIEDYQKES